MSGRSITEEVLETHTSVFHDREYSFDSLGDFQGMTFIKYSNDDKAIDHEHVMTKIRTMRPTTVYIVKLEHHSLGWLNNMLGWTVSRKTGVEFSGVRSTRHKEWDESLLTTDRFAASTVYEKNFPAGTVTLPGNGGGDGSYLIFIGPAHPEEPVVCCQAIEATCLACSARLTVDEYCAQNPGTPGCNPCGTGIEECRAIALSLGLTPGGVGYDFTGDYSSHGCYAYSSGQFAGHAYYGLVNGAAVPDGYRLEDPTRPGAYRPAGATGCFID